MEFSKERIPTWALCYLINGDATGLTDEERQTLDKWWTDWRVQSVCPSEECDLPYFSHSPLFDKAAEVLDCIVMTL